MNVKLIFEIIDIQQQLSSFANPSDCFERMMVSKYCKVCNGIQLEKIRTCNHKKIADHYISRPSKEQVRKTVEYVKSAGAFIGDDPSDNVASGVATVSADGNVVVAAENVTEVDIIGGSIAAAGSAAFGLGGGLTILEKDTEAFIGPNAVVTAKGLGGTSTVKTGSYGTPTITADSQSSLD